LPLLEPLLPDRDRILPALNLRFAQVEVRLDDGLAGVELVLALLELALAPAQLLLELAHALFAAVDALARFEESDKGLELDLAPGDLVCTASEVRFDRGEPRCPLFKLRLGGCQAGRTLVGLVALRLPELLEILDLDADNRWDEVQGGAGLAPAPAAPALAFGPRGPLAVGEIGQDRRLPRSDDGSPRRHVHPPLERFDARYSPDLMRVSMTTVRGPDGLGEPARLAAETMRSWLGQFDGYRGTLVLVDGPERTARFLTFWESAEAEEKSRLGRARMREQMVAAAGVELEGNEVYSVAFVDELGPLR
jgi:hypothetical protein